MADTFESRLLLRQQESGANSGNWGVLLNESVATIASAFGYGNEVLSSDADATITVANDGSSIDAARAAFVKITSSATLTATRTITFAPNTLNQVKTIQNSTTGGQSLIIKQGSGATVTIANGLSKVVYFDGAGSGAAVTDALTNLSVSENVTASVFNADAIAGKYGSSSNPVTFTVTVGSKTSAHPYDGDGSTSAYFLDGIEAPAISLHGADSVTADSEYFYRFDQSDSTNSTHPLLFYLDAAKTTAYTTGVTTNGTPGSSGAYTQIAVDRDTPSVLYYQCSSHSNMGNYAYNAASTNFNGIKMPTADGTSGQVLQTNGSGVLSFATVSGAYNTWLVKTSAYTALAGDQIIVNSASAVTITLPASATAGTTVIIVATGGGTVTVGRNSQNINSTASDGTLASGSSTQLVFVDSTIGFLEI